jgi:hypothetical protein
MGRNMRDAAARPANMGPTDVRPANVDRILKGEMPADLPDLEPVVIDHPVSSITQDEVDARVRQIKERAQKIWMAGEVVAAGCYGRQWFALREDLRVHGRAGMT